MIISVKEATGVSGVRKVLTNSRVITGRVTMFGLGGIPYEGPLERDFLELHDFHRGLAYAGAQPFRITYRHQGKKRLYTPDFRFDPKPRDGQQASPIIYEVKLSSELRENWESLRPGFLAASEYCRSRGWRFRIATERQIRRPRLAQIKFLRDYLDRPDHDCIGQILYRAMKELRVSTPQQLLEKCFASLDRRLEAVAILWSLVADGRIKIDLDHKITMASRIWSPWHEGR